MPAEDSEAYSTPFRASRNERLRGTRSEGSPDTENYPQATIEDVYKRQPVGGVRELRYHAD